MFEILFKTKDVLDNPIRDGAPPLPQCGCLSIWVGGDYGGAAEQGFQE